MYHGAVDKPCDILIAGGGLVGSSLAIALDRLGLRVILADAAPRRDWTAPVQDARNLALAAASVNALRGLGVFDDATPLAPIRHIHVSRQGDFGSVRLDAHNLQLPDFGAVIPAHVLGATLDQALDRCRNLHRLSAAQLVALQQGDSGWQATLEHDGGTPRVHARLLVGADGTQSFVRQAVGIKATELDYQQSAFVTTVATRTPLDGRAFERFTRDGPIALLPLAGNRAGLVFTVPRDQADAVAALDDSAFIAALHERFGYRAGRLSRPGKRQPWPLKRTLAQRLTAARTVLVGNAAQTVHPIGAQGFNLGLRDALTLAELIAQAGQGADPGAAPLLADYVQRRTADRDATTAFSNDLVQLMGNDFLPLGLLRGLGFNFLERCKPAQRVVALRGMGFRGDTPQLSLTP